MCQAAKATNVNWMEGGERCTFSRWKYSHYFEFIEHCAGDKVLSSFKKTLSNLKKHSESQHGTVPPGGAKQRAATNAGGPPLPKQQNLDFGAKPVRGGELKKMVGEYVMEEMQG